MNAKRYVALLPLFLAPLVIAQAKDDPVISTLATCLQSMFDWSDPERQKRILEKFESKADYAIDRRYYLIPRKPATLLGFRIIELSPTGLGKAPGFSAIVEGRFDTVRRTLEAHIGHKLEQCYGLKGGRLCVRKVDDERLIMLRENRAKTLVGCSYPNQK